ncbi:uncharacterized protein LOC123977710 isoform X2 [Micropterus dolomieu]|uniref:uncharacterized protein LOC123977710 isoform X2 n=1 Tax=Micropterus dolomieu TaxID=147949 RepID=UPI001E8DB6E5|nr:uncharacterized protein LOC123977710 isoform X2 [Micropterus dolomieu]
MVGTDLVYENEILHDRQMIADGPNFISRESQFNGINRLSANSVFRSGTPGFGSVDVFKNLKDSAKDCSHQVSGYAANTPTDQVHQTPAPGGVLPYSGIRPQLKPGPSLITVPGRCIKLLYSSQNLQTFPNLNLLPLPELPPIGTHQVPLQVSSNPGLLLSQTQDQHVFRSPTGDHLLNLPPRYDQLPVNSIQLTNLNTPSLKFVEERRENSGLTDENPGSSSSSRIVDEQLETNWGSSSRTRTLEGPNSDNVWYSGLTWDQPTLSQNGIITPDQDLQSLKVYLSPGMKELTQQHEASLDLSHYGSSGVGMEMASTEIPGYQPQSPHGPSQTSHLVLQPPAHYNPVHIGSSEQVLPRSDKKPVPATKHITAKTSDSSGYTQGSVSPDPTATATSPVDQNPGRPGSIERRNIETVQSRVQNIRVKPQGKFVSSGHLETPFTQQGLQPRLVHQSPNQQDTSLDWSSQWLRQETMEDRNLFPPGETPFIQQAHLSSETDLLLVSQEDFTPVTNPNCKTSRTPPLSLTAEEEPAGTPTSASVHSRSPTVLTTSENTNQTVPLQGELG